MSKINKIKVADTTYDIEDTSVPNWAKQETKPTYQYSEIENTPDLSTKLDTNKVKTSQSTTTGEVYDVTYINTMIGDIETLLSEV